MGENAYYITNNNHAASIQLNTYPRKASLLSLTNFKSNKSGCLIVNPAHLTEKLLSEKKFIKYYNPSYLHGGQMSEFELQNINTQRNYHIILIDTHPSYILTYEDLLFINSLKARGKKVYSVTSFFEHFSGKLPLLYLSEQYMPQEVLLNLEAKQNFLLLKRVTDLLVAVLLIPIALPIALIAMGLTVLTSKGPCLFKQKRIGKGGKIFTLYKIRTMVHKPGGHTKHTVHNDDRVTWLGKILRKTKIDELPQLWNMLIGDMSLIGPRPERDDIVSVLLGESPYYHLRHIIRPGLSGWAQVHNPKATPEESFEKLEYDLYYIKNMSFLIELKIIIKTIKVIVTFNSF